MLLFLLTSAFYTSPTTLPRKFKTIRTTVGQLTTYRQIRFFEADLHQSPKISHAPTCNYCRGTIGSVNGVICGTESASTPIGSVHSLDSKIVMALIEMQSGTYLGEHGIVRFEDLYRRP
jgi:hypothetical protein